MKNLTLTLLFLGLFSGLSAQYVTIPDVNFRAELIRLYPSCFNANQEMDTTCSGVVNDDTLFLYSLQINDVYGVNFFSNLKYLYVRNNQLTSLPVLPSSLQYLDCQYNQLTNMPALPSSLQYLFCNSNQLTSLPALPSVLQYLDCHFNQLTSLPALPGSLLNLSCHDNQLTSLPSLPSSLRNLQCHLNQLTSLPILSSNLFLLYCYRNQLTSLPALPSGLYDLNCGSNQLRSLPTLPSGLYNLNCSGNQLTSLPTLPSLSYLSCAYNQLTSLPSLPSGMSGGMDCSMNNLTSLPVLPVYMQSLYCSNNELTSLAALPIYLQELNCSNNQLTSLPALPTTLVSLVCNNNTNLECLPLLPNSLFNLVDSITAITCLPNFTQRINQASSPHPVCTNPNQICQVSPMARGVVYNDANNNGVREASENQVGGIPISISPNNWTGISDSTSGYLVKLDTLPVINTITPGYAYPYRSFTPSSYSVTATSLGLLPMGYDFAMQTQPNITDLVTHLSAWFHRPGFQTSAWVNVENIGTINQTNASISLEIPNGLTVITVTPANGIVIGNTVTWSGESIDIFERKNYSVGLQVPATMPLGTSLTYTAQATPATTDFTPADNIATQTVVVRGSYDPNDKQVNKDRLPNNYVAADEEMLYTIRFQNTGTDTAFTVLVRDTLDLQKLDFSTFRVTGASHALRTNVRERGVVEFVFNNINLPDSFVNEPLSHGYVQFRIHPKANLPLGTQIKNRAFIYFDFNAPIITNFATTTVGLLSVNSAELGTGSLSLYPVPVSEQLTVNFNAVKSGEVRYRLLDLQGRVLQEQQISVGEGENISTMDMSRLGAGMYVLQVVGEGGSVSSKLVKE